MTDVVIVSIYEVVVRMIEIFMVSRDKTVVVSMIEVVMVSRDKIVLVSMIEVMVNMKIRTLYRNQL